MHSVCVWLCTHPCIYSISVAKERMHTMMDAFCMFPWLYHVAHVFHFVTARQMRPIQFQAPHIDETPARCDIHCFLSPAGFSCQIHIFLSCDLSWMKMDWQVFYLHPFFLLRFCGGGGGGGVFVSCHFRVQRVVRVSDFKWHITEQNLEEACGRFGRVKQVKIALDKVILSAISYCRM